MITARGLSESSHSSNRSSSDRIPQATTVGAIFMYCSKSVLLSGTPTRRSSSITVRKIAVHFRRPSVSSGKVSIEPFRVVVPALGHPEGQVRKDQRVETVRVHLDELDPVEQAEAAQNSGDTAVPDSADVVKPDVELPLLLAPEGLAAAAGDVVLLEHQHLASVGREVCRGGQAAETRTDHDRVPLAITG